MKDVDFMKFTDLRKEITAQKKIFHELKLVKIKRLKEIGCLTVFMRGNCFTVIFDYNYQSNFLFKKTIVHDCMLNDLLIVANAKEKPLQLQP